MADAHVVVKTGVFRFPPTRLVDASYGEVVPDKTRQSSSVQELDRHLTQKEEEVGELIGSGAFPISLPPSLVTKSSVPRTEVVPWRQRVQTLRDRLANEIAAYQRSRYIQERHLKQVLPGVRSLIVAARDAPGQTAEVLCSHSITGHTPQCYVRRRVVRCGGGGCKRRAVPFSRFCLKHIHCDVDQVLFRGCQAIDSETLTQCSQPVLDLLSEDAVCTRHVGTAEGNRIQQLRKKQTQVSKAKAKAAMAASHGSSTGGQKVKKTPPSGGRGKGEGRTTTGGKQAARLGKRKAVDPSSTSSLAPPHLPATLSSSSWSSGTESDGDVPAILAQKRARPNPSRAGISNPLPTLPSEAKITFSPPLPTLTLELPPPLPELGKIMEDSDEDETLLSELALFPGLPPLR